MSLVISPARSSAQNRPLASAALMPWPAIAACSWSAMPVPAVPAPKIITRCAGSVVPVALIAASTAARLTAPVPWMSSLKVQS